MRGLTIGVVCGLISTGVFAGDPPTISGGAKISADITGGIANGGESGAGAQLVLKQSVASVLHGTVSGKLDLSVKLKGGIVNGGIVDGAAGITACQSVGSIGSDC